MKHLGIHGFGHDSNKTITIVEDGEVVYNRHIEYERFTRKKRANYPDIQKLTILADEPPDTQINLVLSRQETACTIMNERYTYEEIHPYVNRKLEDNQLIEHPLLGNKLMFITHHLAHAAYSYYTRPDYMEDTDIFSYDGKGLEVDTTFHNNTTLVQSEITGIGMLWDNTSRSIFKDFHSEGKVMGLAAYGQYKEELEKFFLENLERQKSYKFNKFPFPGHNDFEDNIRDLHKSAKEFKEEDVAHTLQKFSEVYISDYIKKYKNSDNLCISGGVGLNGYINQMLVETKLYDNIHIPPACSDSGLSFGANLFAINKEFKWVPKEIRYIGKQYYYQGDPILQLPYEDIYPLIAKKISEGKIIGWYQGRSESGPRALGNRSILCDPTDPKMKDYLNEKVKHREHFRPFAPAILKEDVTDWFENVTDAPNMLKICKYKEGMGEKVPSVCHEDYTGRLQTVTEESNHHFYNLIKAFKDLTGVPILLNTSFNDNGKPMVETPFDARKTFHNTNIDILVINDYVYEKRLTIKE